MNRLVGTVLLLIAALGFLFGVAAVVWGCTFDACRDCTANTEVDVTATVEAPCIVVNLTADASLEYCRLPDGGYSPVK